MSAIAAQASSDQVDFVGASFAASADVLPFWKSVQCQPVRLGVSRDASSGCHSLVVPVALISGRQGIFAPACGSLSAAVSL